jgi:hypothetical protein
MRKKKKILRPTIMSQRWPGENTLATVRQLNTRFLALMAEQSHDDATFSSLWAQVDERALVRAGCCPVLLVDLNFQRPEWWQRANQRSADTVLAEGPHEPENARAILLVRQILMDALTIGRTMPRALNLIFGMASPVMGIIVRLGPLEIDRIAVEEARRLKARWSESRSFWKRLLEAAIGTDDRALANVHLHCLQLLGGDLLLT